jgi:predicted nucleic acid-binding protein
MSILAIVDAGPLYAAADADDENHAACLATLARPDLRPVLATMAIAEATYFVSTRLGATAERMFLDGLKDLDVEGPDGKDFTRMAELVEQYRDWPFGGTDASIVALAERLQAPAIVTLDHRHFAAVRPRHQEAFELLP